MISVIVPVYNVENDLDTCLTSIVNQSYADLEIIIVDDGSTDGSGEICDRYAAQDQRIRLIHQKNQGPSVARNRGIDIATGDYIVFVDGDDFLLPNGIERLYSICKEQNADYVQCNFLTCGEKEGPADVHCPDVPVEIQVFEGGYEKMQAYVQTRKIGTYLWGKIYDRKLFAEIRLPVGKIYEDIYTSLNLVEAAQKIVLASEYSCVYRLRSNSITKCIFTPARLDGIVAYIDSEEFIRESYPKLIPAAYTNILAECRTCLLSMTKCKYENKEVDRWMRKVVRKYVSKESLNAMTLHTKLFTMAVCYCYPIARLALKIFYSMIMKKRANVFE